MEELNTQKLCEQLNQDSPEKAYPAYRTLTLKAFAVGAPGKDAERQKFAEELAAQLVRTRTVGDAKRKQEVPVYGEQALGEIARVLSLVAGPAQLPALEKAMQNFDAREAERVALQRVQGAEATKAIADMAANAVGNDFRVGLINALGARGGDDAIETLKACASDNNAEVRLAAFRALGQSSDASVDSLFAESMRSASPQEMITLGRARFSLAANLAKSGNKEAATQVCKALIADKRVGKPQHKAAEMLLKSVG